jgi:hypothetical protein
MKATGESPPASSKNAEVTGLSIPGVNEVLLVHPDGTVEWAEPSSDPSPVQVNYSGYLRRYVPEILTMHDAGMAVSEIAMRLTRYLRENHPGVQSVSDATIRYILGKAGKLRSKYPHGRPPPRWPDRAELPLDEKLAMPLNAFETTVRVANALNNSGINTIGELIQQSEAELLRIPNFGRVSLAEVKGLLASLGLQLTPHEAPWQPRDAAHMTSEPLSDADQNLLRLACHYCALLDSYERLQAETVDLQVKLLESLTALRQAHSQSGFGGV